MKKMFFHQKTSIYLIWLNLILCFSEENVQKYVENINSVLKQSLEERIISKVKRSVDRESEYQLFNFSKNLLPSVLSLQNKTYRTARVITVGGVLEFNSPLYNAAVSALDGGAETSFVYFVKVPKFPTVIKPKLIFLVFPNTMDTLNIAVSKFSQMTSAVIGPGLGGVLEDYTVVEDSLEDIIYRMRYNMNFSMPLIFDEDGIKLFSKRRTFLRNYRGPVYINQNVLGIKHLAATYFNKTSLDIENKADLQKLVKKINPRAILILQHENEKDEIITANETYTCSFLRPPYKCECQEAITSGLLGLYSHYARLYRENVKDITIPPEVGASYAALAVSNLCCRLALEVEKEHNILPPLLSEFSNATHIFFRDWNSIEQISEVIFNKFSK